MQPDFDPDAVARLAWRALRRLGVPDHVLPDAVQDTLLVVHRRTADFRAEATFESWIYGIVLRVASGHRRRERRSLAALGRSVSGEDEQLSSSEPSPFERMEQKAAAELLLQLLDELPEELRDLFVLVELEELTVQQASEALNCALSTGRSRLRTARRLFEAAVARTRARLSRVEVRQP